MANRRLIKGFLLLGVLLGGSGCIVQSQVQGRYLDAQENCRDQAEAAVAKLPNVNSMTPQQQSAEVVNQFSLCMNQSGWHVANPLKPKPDKTAANTDAGVQPAEVSSAARVGAARSATTPAPQKSVSPAAASTTPDSTATAPAQYERLQQAPATQGDERNGRQF